MKNLSRLLVLGIFAFMCNSSFAQLLERENVQSRIVAGTRPVQGDFGFMLGISIQELDEIFDRDLKVAGLPLMSFKYYLTDQIELRLNTQTYVKSKKILGDLVGVTGQEDNVDKETFYRFMPSAQYHFSSSNLLDTYAGVGIIVGSERDEILTSNRTNLTGDFFAEQLSKKTFVTGFNLNFGLQAFIADLPIALAAEASVRGLKHSNLQYEGRSQSSVGGVVTDQTYFTIDSDASLRYQSLKYQTYELGADIRILISYFFRK